MRTLLLAILSLMLVVHTPSLAYAQISTDTDSQPITAEPTSVFVPSDFTQITGSIVLSKFLRFFTINPTKDAELTNAIANALLLKFIEQQAAGQTEQATSTLAKYERETELLTTVVATIQAGTTNSATTAFLDTLMVDRAVQIAAIEATIPPPPIDPTADPTVPTLPPTDIASRLIAVQAKVLRDIARTLEKETDPLKRDEKLASVIAHYTKKQTKLEAKLAKKLTFIAKLDDETDDDELEADLDQDEDEALEDAGEFDELEVDELLEELESLSGSRRATVLTKLLEKVPAAAQPGIEQAINQKLEVAKKQVEKAREATKKAQEAAREQTKQSEESQSDNSTEDTDDDGTADEADDEQSSSSGSPTSTTTPTPATSPTTTPSSSSGSGSDDVSGSVERETIEIKIEDDGTFDATIYSVKKGAELTIKFKNESEVSHTLTLSNGKSATLGKGETSLTPFTFDAALTFTATGVTGSGTIGFK